MQFSEAALLRSSYKKVFWKYVENLQETPMPEWDFNKIAKELYWNHTSEWVFSCKFAEYFQNTFSKEHPWRAASQFWGFSMLMLQSKSLFSLYSRQIYSNCRSSRPEVFCKKAVLRNFTKFFGKHLCRSLFFNNLFYYYKRNSGTGVFLWILRNF